MNPAWSRRRSSGLSPWMDQTLGLGPVACPMLCPGGKGLQCLPTLIHSVRSPPFPADPPAPSLTFRQV